MNVLNIDTLFIHVYSIIQSLYYIIIWIIRTKMMVCFKYIYIIYNNELNT